MRAPRAARIVVVLMVAASFALGYFFWDPAIAAVTGWLESYELVKAFLGWLDRLGAGALRTVFAPLLVLALATPLIVLGVLLLVAVFMTPSMVDLVAQRRFPLLERRQGGSFIASALWSVGSLLLEVAAEQNTMLICVTHSLELAQRFARRYELQEGRLVEQAGRVIDEGL